MDIRRACSFSFDVFIHPTCHDLPIFEIKAGTHRLQKTRAKCLVHLHSTWCRFAWIARLVQSTQFNAPSSYCFGPIVCNHVCSDCGICFGTSTDFLGIFFLRSSIYDDVCADGYLLSPEKQKFSRCLYMSMAFEYSLLFFHYDPSALGADSGHVYRISRRGFGDPLPRIRLLFAWK